MAIRKFYVPAIVSPVADYVLWGQAISNAIGALGWTKTSDTGQVNWPTVTSVSVLASSPYEIWQATDALASTSPLLFKITYGLGYNPSSGPGLYLQIGSGSNGSGTLTGSYSSASATIAPANGSASLFECDASGNGGRLCFNLWRGLGSVTQSFFTIERANDGNGNALGTAATLTLGSVTNVGFLSQTISLGSSLQSLNVTETSPVCVHTTSPTATVGAAPTPAIAAAPVYNYVGGYALQSLIAVKVVDIADGVIFTQGIEGNTNTYLSLTGITGLNLSSRLGGGTGLAMLWQ